MPVSADSTAGHGMVTEITASKTGDLDTGRLFESLDEVGQPIAR